MPRQSLNAPGSSLAATAWGLLPVILAACGGRPPMKPVPDMQALGLSCADAYVIGSATERPSRLEVWNESGSDVRLDLDQCGQQIHLGWARSGSRTAFRLPARLVYFPEGLRVHAYRDDAAQQAMSFGVDPGAIVARLVIPGDDRTGKR